MPFKECQIYQKAFYANVDHWRTDLPAVPTVDAFDASVTGSLKMAKLFKDTAASPSPLLANGWVDTIQSVALPAEDAKEGGAKKAWLGIDLKKASEKDARGFNEKHREIILKALNKGGIVVDDRTAPTSSTRYPPITPFLIPSAAAATPASKVKIDSDEFAAPVAGTASILFDCKGLNRIIDNPPRLEPMALGECVQFLSVLDKSNFVAVAELKEWANQIPLVPSLQKYFSLAVGNSSVPSLRLQSWPVGFAWTAFVGQSMAMLIGKLGIEYNAAPKVARSTTAEEDGGEKDAGIGAAASEEGGELYDTPLFAVAPTDRCDVPPTYWIISTRAVASYTELSRQDVVGMLSITISGGGGSGGARMLLVTRKESLRDRVVDGLIAVSDRYRAKWCAVDKKALAAQHEDDSDAMAYKNAFLFTKNAIPSFQGVQLFKAKKVDALSPNEWLWGHLEVNRTKVWPALKKEERTWRTATRITDVLVYDWQVAQQSHAAMRDVFAIVQRIGAIDFKKDADWDVNPPTAAGSLPPFFTLHEAHPNNSSGNAKGGGRNAAPAAAEPPAAKEAAQSRAAATQQANNFITAEEWSMLFKRLDYCCQKGRGLSVGLQHFGGGDVATRTAEAARRANPDRTILLAADTAVDKGAVLVFGEDRRGGGNKATIAKVNVVNYKAIPTHGPGSVWGIGHGGVMPKDMNWKETYIVLEALDKEVGLAEKIPENRKSKLYFHIATDNVNTMAVLNANCIPWCATLAGKAASVYNRLDANGWVLRVTVVSPSVQPAFELSRGSGGSDAKVQLCVKALKEVDEPWTARLVKSVRDEE